MPVPMVHRTMMPVMTVPPIAYLCEIALIRQRMHPDGRRRRPDGYGKQEETRYDHGQPAGRCAFLTPSLSKQSIVGQNGANP